MFTPRMTREFDRYQLARLRMAVGSLQWLASAGLLIGLSQPLVGRAAASGLAAMMLTGIFVRIKIKDTAILMMPALFYLLLNVYLCVAAF